MISDSNNGHTSWTTWMRYAGKDGKVVSTRYRDCNRGIQGTVCHAKLQKQTTEGRYAYHLTHIHLYSKYMYSCGR